ELRHQRVLESRTDAPLAAFACLRDGRIVALWVGVTDARRMLLSVEILGQERGARRTIAELDGGPWTGVARPSASVIASGGGILVASAVRSEVIELSDAGAVLRVLRTADSLSETRPNEIEALIEHRLPLRASAAD